jgi:hypothetical protein
MIRMNKICSVEGCNKKIKAKKLCDMHLKRLERTGDLGSPYSKHGEKILKINKTSFNHKECNAANCSEKAMRLGLCETHLSNWEL